MDMDNRSVIFFFLHFEEAENKSYMKNISKCEHDHNTDLFISLGLYGAHT